MKVFKKIIFSATAIAMVGLSSQHLEAQNFIYDGELSGYEDARSAPSLTPALALAAVAVVAVIASTGKGGHGGHVHAH